MYHSYLYNISSFPSELTKDEALQSVIHENLKFNFICDPSTNSFTAYMKSNQSARISIKNVIQCRSGMFRIVASITEQLANLLENQGLIIEHTVCKLYKITKHNRCFNCLLPGHIAKNCNNSTVCSRCSEEHSFHDCKSNFEKCIFCLRKNLTDIAHPSYLCPLDNS